LQINCTHIFINAILHRTSHRDETQDDIAPSNPEITQVAEFQPSPLPSAFAPTTNGHVNNINLKAHSANNTLSAPTSEDLVVAEVDQESSQDLQAQLPDTNTTTTSEDALPPATTSDLFDPIDSALDSTSDHPAPSTVPPIIDAPKSDVRDEVSSSKQEPPAELAVDRSLSAIQPTSENDLPVRPPQHSAAATNITFDQPSNDLPQPPISDEASSQAIPASTNDTMTEADETETNPNLSIKSESSLPTQDTTMTDAPPLQQSTKVPREREDDTEDEPSAKRTKTEDSEELPDAPHANHNGQNGEGSHAGNNKSVPITAYAARETIKILKNAVKTANGKPFKAPVTALYPGLKEQYSAKIQNPIDLGTIEKKLKDSVYASWDAFKADLDLMGDNAENFNGPDHAVTKSARLVRDSIMSKLQHVPREPPPPQVQIQKEKKPAPKKATPVPEAPRAPAPRRLSRGSASAPPKKPVQTESYAPNPTTGVPIIRRDSNQIDNDRPKRAIHPPKNKDLPYASSRPKPKKGSLELKFCEVVLAEIMKPKHLYITTPFLVPVDPVALAIPAYFTIIKNPMDLRTVSEKLHQGVYTKAKDFESDMRLIHQNCIKFNPKGNPVNAQGEQFLALFEQEWANKNQYIAEHERAERQRVVQSPETANEDEEESEGEVEVEVATEVVVPPALTQRLAEEQQKLIDLLQKTPNSTEMITMQQNLVAVVQKMIAEAKAASVKKVVKKSKAPKPAKKPGPVVKKARPDPPAKKGAARQKQMGVLEKEVISTAMNVMSEETLAKITDIIKSKMDGLEVS